MNNTHDRALMREALEAWCDEERFDRTYWLEHRPEAGYKDLRLNDYMTGWLARATIAKEQP